jgi:hypothetical protein
MTRSFDSAPLHRYKPTQRASLQRGNNLKFRTEDQKNGFFNKLPIGQLGVSWCLETLEQKRELL